MSEERRMRIVSRSGDWCVQYGFDRQRGSTRRFIALREWPAKDLQEAYAVAAREKIAVAFDPPEPGAAAVEQKQHVARAIAEAPSGIAELLKSAVTGLTDPLPTVEESHSVMGVPAPLPHNRGRQFYLYLAEPVYGRLVAMAAAAGVTRNRIIEALLLNAEEGGGDEPAL